MRIIEVNDLKSEELSLYTSYTENQLYHIYEPDEGVFIAETANVILRALDNGYKPLSFLVEPRYLQEAKEMLSDQDVPIYVAPIEVLCQLTGYNLTRGMLCAFRRKKLPDLKEVCRNAKRIAILENVMNPTNVGAIVRSAAALNIDAILFTSGCADPLYRRAARVAMGTIFQLPWTILDKEEWPEKAMAYFKENNIKTVALALKENAVPIDDEKLNSEEKMAIILGTESTGIEDNTLQLVDYTTMIPMAHEVDSLNVAAASALAFWQLRSKK